MGKTGQRAGRRGSEERREVGVPAVMPRVGSYPLCPQLPASWTFVSHRTGAGVRRPTAEQAAYRGVGESPFSLQSLSVCCSPSLAGYSAPVFAWLHLGGGGEPLTLEGLVPALVSPEKDQCVWGGGGGLKLALGTEASLGKICNTHTPALPFLSLATAPALPPAPLASWLDRSEGQARMERGSQNTKGRNFQAQ